MKAKSPIEYLKERLYDKIQMSDDLKNYYFDMAEQYHQIGIKNAVIYGLDEDGHTGSWKNSVAENYYLKTYTDENNS